MLSRVANSIYWLARYIERAENVARSIDVNLQLQLDLPGEERPWEPVIQIAGNADDFFKKYAHVSIENALMFLTFDKENPNSIISCVGTARENARCVRERISSELWIAINQFYLKLNDPEMPKEALAGPHAFYNSVKEFSQLTAGIIQGTMNHDVAWNFTHLGTLLERADQTSRILFALRRFSAFLALLPRKSGTVSQEHRLPCQEQGGIHPPLGQAAFRHRVHDHRRNHRRRASRTN